ncbi:MAG TPA: ATP-binding cassette domain-containing protein, partial [Candidatus Cloacimonadota bacterium]|nr:ATP-binding cassette domain-containing protein [Candidatus Cloacimonadota bacterium]
EFSKLGPFSKRKAGALSGGMKQKLALSCNLMHTPKIMILDEPTFGVDPVSREEFWQILHNLNKSGTTILVSTPYMEEAAQCTRIALLRKGLKISEGTPEEIISTYPHKLYLLRANDIHQMHNVLQSEDYVVSTQLFGDSLHVAYSQKPSIQQWNDLIEKSKHNLIQYEEITPSIEDVFLSAGN